MKIFLIIALIAVIFILFIVIKSSVDLEALIIYNNFSLLHFKFPKIGLSLSNSQGMSNVNFNLTGGVFLIASQNIVESTFSKSVILLIKYDRTGAIGLIINKPSNVKLKKIYHEAKGFFIRNKRVFFGGPVSFNSLFIMVLSKKSLDASISIKVFDNVYLISNFNEIRDILPKKVVKKQLRIFAGYAGWAPGQLEYEVSRGDWYIVPADVDNLFFKEPEKIWPELIKKSLSRLVMKLLTYRIFSSFSCTNTHTISHI